MQQNNKESVKPLTRVLLLLSVILITVCIQAVFCNSEIIQTDHYFTGLVTRWKSDNLSSVMFLFTRAGNYQSMITFYVILTAYILFIKKNKKLAFKISFIALSTVGILQVLKQIFQRARPVSEFIFDQKGYSFPSGHSMNSLVFFLLLIFLVERSKLNLAVKRVLNLSFLIIPLLIGFSRVYLGVHYFTDIVAGFSFAYVWYYVASLGLDKFLYKTKAPN